MKALLQQACHRVNAGQSKVLSAAACKALRKRYRTILTQGCKELPALPPRRMGHRGRIAKSDAHNLHERLAQREESVLRFRHDSDVTFTNNAGERGLRMSNVKMKASGSFRTLVYGEALCPHLQLPAVHGSARLQSSCRHSIRARRQRCRHARTTLWPTTTSRLDTNRGASGFLIPIHPCPWGQNFYREGGSRLVEMH